VRLTRSPPMWRKFSWAWPGTTGQSLSDCYVGPTKTPQAKMPETGSRMLQGDIHLGRIGFFKRGRRQALLLKQIARCRLPLRHVTGDGGTMRIRTYLKELVSVKGGDPPGEGGSARALYALRPPHAFE
jgi:hypothetical protein